MRPFGGGLVVCSTRPEHAAQLAQLQRIVFPTLSPAERFEEQHYRHHVELFPEGQFCVLDGERVVGATSTIRMDFDFQDPVHTFAEVFQGGWLTAHDPAGPWLYGADVGVDPDYRRRGIARALYATRHELVRRLGLRGQVTVGSPSGYSAVKGTVTAEQYHRDLVTGARTDPTISPQQAVGFEVRDLVPGYLTDPICDGYGIVLVLPAEREVRFPP